MPKKQVFTNAEIEKDIIGALKHPPHDSEAEASSKKWMIPAAIVAVPLVVITVINPTTGCLLLLAVCALMMIVGIVNNLRIKYRMKMVSICDYNITTEIVYSISEEHYEENIGVKSRYTVQRDNYTIHFESGKEWRIPKENYNWHERLRMQDLGVFHSTHRGDTMLVVTDKKTDRIVMAYNTELFEYKN